MDYAKVYAQLIKRSQNLNRIKSKENYFERHHILPKCLGGSNDKTNLVLLTAREHFLAHMLLTKMYEGEAKQKMYFAMWRMCNTKDGHKPSAKQYEDARKLLAIASSESKKGKPGFIPTAETRKKMSEAGMKRIVSESTKDKISKGNLGKVRSEELKKIWSDLKLGKKQSKETCDKKSKYFKGKTYIELYGLEKANELKESRRQKALKQWQVAPLK